MIDRVNSIVKNPLFGGSALMIIGSNVVNVLAYLYHLIIGRMLGPSSYGELSAVISVLGLLFTSFNFLGLVIVKFVSAAKENQVFFIFNWFTERTYKVGLAIGIFILLISPLLSGFLHLKLSVTVLVAPVVFFAFLTFIYRSFAQGLLKFWAVVLSTNLDLTTRILFGILFIYMGFSVEGAVTGILIAMILSFWYLKKNVAKYIKKGKTGDLKFASKVAKYSIPILFATLATNSMFTTDVILVKHFFDSHNAGIYASISTLGRIIFYGTGPVSAVMFPLIAKKYSNKENFNSIFWLSLLMTFAISATVLFVFYAFPELSIKMLFGMEYIEGARYLFLFGIFMTLYALSSLIFNFFLSIEETRVVYLSVIVATIQTTGIYIWHGSIDEVIRVSIYCTLLFLISLIVYYFNYNRLHAKTN